MAPMRKRPKHSRSGPGLIDVMARSAVLAGSSEIEPVLAKPSRRRPMATTAAARYDQLLELMAAGILTSEEVTGAVERLTAQASLAAVRHRRRATDARAEPAEGPPGAARHH
jgi:hypothetical protein